MRPVDSLLDKCHLMFTNLKGVVSVEALHRHYSAIVLTGTHRKILGIIIIITLVVTRSRTGRFFL